MVVGVGFGDVEDFGVGVSSEFVVSVFDVLSGESGFLFDFCGGEWGFGVVEGFEECFVFVVYGDFVHWYFFIFFFVVDCSFRGHVLVLLVYWVECSL